MKDIYELLIIGGGISACTLASCSFKNGFNGKIGLIEAGRGLGGRSGSRFNETIVFNHGAPNFNISNISKNPLLEKFINELLDQDYISHDDSSVFELDIKQNFSNIINNNFYTGARYKSKYSMSKLARQIINLNIKNNKIDFFFKNLVIDLEFSNGLWVIRTKNGNILRSRFLVLTSNLLLHNRSLKIINTNQIPLRNTFPLKRSLVIDEIIYLLKYQQYIERNNFLIVPGNNYCYANSYKDKDLHILFDQELEKKIGFERIIFQNQFNNNLGIVIHTRNKGLIRKSFENQKAYLFNKSLINQFNSVFENNKLIKKIDLFKDITFMRWRASQPIGKPIPQSLQVCKEFNLAFSGDWFDFEGFGRYEGALLSSLVLSEKIKNLL